MLTFISVFAIMEVFCVD